MAKLACQQRYHGLNYTKLPPRKGRLEAENEVMREVGRVGKTRTRKEGRGGKRLTWREECEMGDSKVTVWERDGEAQVVVERQMVTC